MGKVQKFDQNSNTPVIAGVEITTDEHGRFNLNALHKAAVEKGVEKDIRPNEWLSLQGTKEMIEVLITENPAFAPMTSKAGRYGGTFVVELDFKVQFVRSVQDALSKFF